MTSLATPIADVLVRLPHRGKATANAQNSSAPSNICVGSRLRVRRTSRGLSQQELSERLGIDRDHLSAYEAGSERVSASLLLQIGKLLDVRPDYFFRGYTEEELEGCLEWRKN
jgi:ribosome-binding protein aMBF1 (putative translation factor)